MVTPLKTCLVCAITFRDSKHPRKKFCSKKCAGLFKRKRTFKKCPSCLNNFEQSVVGQKYCTYDCARVGFSWRKGKIFTRLTKKCLICSKEFNTVPTSTKQHCCSRACAALRRKHKALIRASKWKIRKPCIFCTVKFIPKNRKQQYCSKRCAMLKYMLTRYPDKYIPVTRTKKVRQSARLKFKNCCNRCGYNNAPQILEIHHIDRNSKNNSEINIELLCPNCHSLDHFKHKDGQYHSSKK